MEPRPRTPRRRKSVAASGKAPAAHVKGDPELEATYSDIMELWEESDQRNTGHVSREEQDAVRHMELQFAAGLRLALTEQLDAQGIRCHSVLPDGEHNGYVIDCRDRMGRLYSARLGFDEAVPLIERHEDWERKLLHLVCKRILEAREKYYRRAGLI